MKDRNQKIAVLNYMRAHGSITSFEAFQKLNITRLSAQIFILRADGHNIASIRRGTINSYGNPCSYVEYRLMKENTDAE